MAQKKNVKRSSMAVASLPNGGKAPGKTSTPTPVTKKMGNHKVKSCQ